MINVQEIIKDLMAEGISKAEAVMEARKQLNHKRVCNFISNIQEDKNRSQRYRDVNQCKAYVHSL